MSKCTLAALTAFALVAPAGAFAASCPPEHVLTEPREIENAPDVGIDRPVLATVDLTGWRGMGNFLLRMRRITVAPNGIVPTHWHNDRPSIVFIMEGEIIEHSTFCAVPVLHKTGESPEFGDSHGHWWENNTTEPVVILSTDVVPFEMKDDPNM